MKSDPSIIVDRTQRKVTAKRPGNNETENKQQTKGDNHGNFKKQAHL